MCYFKSDIYKCVSFEFNFNAITYLITMNLIMLTYQVAPIAMWGIYLKNKIETIRNIYFIFVFIKKKVIYLNI